MNKYKLLIEGKNFRIEFDGIEKNLGFYTNRYVETVDIKSAEEVALNLIRKELDGLVLNSKSDPPLMFIEEIEELSSFGEAVVPGAGFTWFEEAENE